jgi:hypothetical protein
MLEDLTCRMKSLRFPKGERVPKSCGKLSNVYQGFFKIRVVSAFDPLTQAMLLGIKQHYREVIKILAQENRDYSLRQWAFRQFILRWKAKRFTISSCADSTKATDRAAARLAAKIHSLLFGSKMHGAV